MKINEDFQGDICCISIERMNFEPELNFICRNCPNRIHNLIRNIVLVKYLGALKSASLKFVVLARRRIANLYTT